MLAYEPETLYIEITTECNLRCKQCHMWRSRREPNSLSGQQRAEVIREFSRLSPNGGVVFTGGEPLLESAELFALARLCRCMGLRTLVNTNGTLLDNSGLDRLLEDGPDVVVFSIDSVDARVHDYMRGVPGSHEAVLKSMGGLVARRAAAGASRPLVYASGILCELTIDGAESLVRWLRGRGIDGVTFQVLERTFMLKAPQDSFFEEHWFAEGGGASAKLGEMASLFAGDPFVLLSGNDFRWMKARVVNREVLPTPVCGAHERTVWVDSCGNTRLCSYMDWLFEGRTLGIASKDSLERMLASDFAREVRRRMSECTRTCGMLNCHRKVSPQCDGDLE